MEKAVLNRREPWGTPETPRLVWSSGGSEQEWTHSAEKSHW